MKTLLILRHAKSSWKDASLSDNERPLNKRGIRSAQLIGKFIARRKLAPEVVLSSPAARARETAEIVVDVAKLNVVVHYDERLYLASSRTLMEVIAQVEDQFAQVLVVGHNSGMEDLVGVLTGQESHMPTAALARVRIEVESWREVRARTGFLEGIIRPRDITAESL